MRPAGLKPTLLLFFAAFLNEYAGLIAPAIAAGIPGTKTVWPSNRHEPRVLRRREIHKIGHR